ncbi:rod shape-determining protein RodA [Patescibacteria group bacterium]|nr:rod shape-determining protein RodA [Patescibacteria group bacterium]
MFRLTRGRVIKFDVWLLVCVGALISIGFLTLKSIQVAGGALTPNILDRQFLALIIGIAVLTLLSSFNYRYFLYFFPIFYLLAVASLIAVLVFGDSVRGAVRWFELAGLQFQPSEVVKPLLIVCFAFFSQWARGKFNDWLIVLISFLLLLPVQILIFLEPDLSTMIVVFAIWLGFLWMGLEDLKPLITVSLITLALLPLIYFVLSPYQSSRLSSFLDPYKDPLGTGYNAIQATIAVGSGQIWGRQWGKGTQSHLSFLPDQHTDFIFATFCEEQGFIGAVVLIVIYSLFFWRLLLIMSQIKEYVGRIIVGSVFVMFFVQFVINIGMNIGLLPVTGIPLPFVSYGGTSLVISLASVGLIQGVLMFEV